MFILLRKHKNDNTDDQRTKYNNAIKLIQEIQRDEGTVDITTIPAYDDVLVGSKKITPEDVRINYERDVAKMFATAFTKAFGYQEFIGDLSIAYASLYWFELKRNDTTTIGG